MGNRKSKYSECYSDNPASVINLSDNVVKRIAEGNILYSSAYSWLLCMYLCRYFYFLYVPIYYTYYTKR